MLIYGRIVVDLFGWIVVHLWLDRRCFMAEVMFIYGFSYGFSITNLDGRGGEEMYNGMGKLLTSLQELLASMPEMASASPIPEMASEFLEGSKKLSHSMILD